MPITSTTIRANVLKPPPPRPNFYLWTGPGVTYDPAMDATLQIIVNGQPREVPKGSTVAALINDVGLGKAACAAEINRVLVPRRDRETRQIQPGDVIELVTLVGGG